MICYLQGYGFVDFESPTSALAAVHELQGQGIQVNICKSLFEYLHGQGIQGTI